MDPQRQTGSAHEGPGRETDGTTPQLPHVTNTSLMGAPGIGLPIPTAELDGPPLPERVSAFGRPPSAGDFDDADIDTAVIAKVSVATVDSPGSAESDGKSGDVAQAAAQVQAGAAKGGHRAAHAADDGETGRAVEVDELTQERQGPPRTAPAAPLSRRAVRQAREAAIAAAQQEKSSVAADQPAAPTLTATDDLSAQPGEAQADGSSAEGMPRHESTPDDSAPGSPSSSDVRAPGQRLAAWRSTRRAMRVSDSGEFHLDSDDAPAREPGAWANPSEASHSDTAEAQQAVAENAPAVSSRDNEVDMVTVLRVPRPPAAEEQPAMPQFAMPPSRLRPTEPVGVDLGWAEPPAPVPRRSAAASETRRSPFARLAARLGGKESGGAGERRSLAADELPALGADTESPAAPAAPDTGSPAAPDAGSPLETSGDAAPPGGKKPRDRMVVFGYTIAGVGVVVFAIALLIFLTGSYR